MVDFPRDLGEHSDAVVQALLGIIQAINNLSEQVGTAAPAAAEYLVAASDSGLTDERVATDDEVVWDFATPGQAIARLGLSMTQGSVIYRGASGWAALGPGTAGQVLTTNGAGNDPTWETLP